MTEHGLPESPPVEQVSPKPAALVGSRKEFEEKANRQENVPFAEHPAIFGTIAEELKRHAELAETGRPIRAADTQAFAEANAARHRMATSFLNLVISKAYEKKHTSLSVDDCIGLGCLLLYKAIDKARLPDQWSFAAYAEPVIRFGLGREIWFKRLGVRTSGSALDEIIEYRYQKFDFYREHGREASPSEMAEILKIDKAWAFHLECFAEDEVLVDDIGEDLGTSFLDKLAYERYFMTHDPDPQLLIESREKKAITIERGLAVIAPYQATVLNLFYGFDGEPPLDTWSIAQELDLLEQTVKAAINHGHAALSRSVHAWHTPPRALRAFGRAACNRHPDAR